MKALLLTLALAASREQAPPPVEQIQVVAGPFNVEDFSKVAL